ncbi:MFS transporter [Bradyrhizobium sp.]|uniref:MFS transporter n=1 Tax=Bradyrhizobium sp. TaxID=376 RepID=UPI001EC778BE|nr:MFS transporter [Bradyrhizobium sp.]MBV9984249.1 MFS transporter [Bradyrhizobium sp.]
MTLLNLVSRRTTELTGRAAVSSVAAMIGAAFAGSTLVTPLYVIYKEQFGFSQITLTLVYGAYVLGNLVALLFLGHLSDRLGRRRTTIPAMAIAILSALVFLFADGVAWLYAGRILSGISIGIATGTGTAWLAELIGRKDKTLATAIATSVNFLGLATSALIAGVLAQYAPWPLRLPFIIYMAALVVVAALIWRTQETIAHPRGLQRIPFRPNVSVPPEIRAEFIAPAVTGFGAMALVGFFAAIGPTVLAQDLHVANHAVAGALFFELAMTVAATILLTQRLPSRMAMLVGLGLMIPSVVLVVSAQVLASMWLLIAATACCAVAAALGYRGSLQVVNQIAPEQKRAAVVSSYFICGFSGNALPVIGVGVISTLAGAVVADAAFAALIIAFALTALAMRLIYRK